MDSSADGAPVVPSGGTRCRARLRDLATDQDQGLLLERAGRIA
jgi:hypothetical protein